MLVIIYFLTLVSFPAHAEDTDEADLASGVYLAYVETGDEDADRTSENGLAGLAQILKIRTTIDVRGVHGVDPASDRLFYYPFLYWPMTETGGDLSASAARNLQSYMAEGGMVFFDTRDAQFGDAGAPPPGTQRLRGFLRNLDIPALAPVGEGHILTKSFYLLDDFPGRFAGGGLWGEKEPNRSFDGITSVVIGSNDYAAAWSRDERDRARFDIAPGGERQREMAYRAGVNIVMTALAGNYKSDQVHVPYILERLGR